MDNNYFEKDYVVELEVIVNSFVIVMELLVVAAIVHGIWVVVTGVAKSSLIVVVNDLVARENHVLVIFVGGSASEGKEMVDGDEIEGNEMVDGDEIEGNEMVDGDEKKGNEMVDGDEKKENEMIDGDIICLVETQVVNHHLRYQYQLH